MSNHQVAIFGLILFKRVFLDELIFSTILIIQEHQKDTKYLRCIIILSLKMGNASETIPPPPMPYT